MRNCGSGGLVSGCIYVPTLFGPLAGGRRWRTAGGHFPAAQSRELPRDNELVDNAMLIARGVLADARVDRRSRPARRLPVQLQRNLSRSAPDALVTSAPWRCASSRLGIEAPERFAAGEPLYRVHECGPACWRWRASPSTRGCGRRDRQRAAGHAGMLRPQFWMVSVSL
jgi:hypothetical protein